MGWLSERMLFQGDLRFQKGLAEHGTSALDGKLGASLVLGQGIGSIAPQVGVFGTGGFAIEDSIKPYAGGGVSLSLGLLIPSSFGVTLSGEVLTRGARFSAMVNLPIPVTQAWGIGMAPHISVGYLYEYKTDFRSGTQGESIHGVGLSAGFDILAGALGVR